MDDARAAVCRAVLDREEWMTTVSNGTTMRIKLGSGFPANPMIIRVAGRAA